MKAEEFARGWSQDRINFTKYELPIEIGSDHDYYNVLLAKLDNYANDIKNSQILNQVTKENTKRNIEAIKNSLVMYYKGNLSKAKLEIENVISEYTKKDSYIVSTINSSPAFYGFLANNLNMTPTFFRTRSGKERFLQKDLLPIPMNMRERIPTNRFSVPGIPCLYLGSSSYCCWLELDRPSDDIFNVAAIKVDGDKKIFNMAFDGATLNEISMFAQADSKKTINLRENFIQVAEEMIELWPLVCATSFSNKNSTSNFRSEYIISQIVMEIIGETEGIYGIAYLSKKVTNRIVSGVFPFAVNLAIPMSSNADGYENYNHGHIYGTQLESIKITNPYNMADYTKFSTGHKNKKKLKGKKTLANALNINLVQMDSEQFHYEELVFGKFDEYLNNREFQTAITFIE